MKSINMLCLIIVGIIIGLGHVNGLLFIDVDYGKTAINIKYLWPVFVYAVAAMFVIFFRYIASEGAEK